MKWYKYSWLLIAALVCMVSCKEEEEEPIPIAPTLEITKSNIDVSYTQAAINLQVETKATIQEMVAEYTTDSAFGTFSQTKMTVKVDTKNNITTCNVTIFHLTDHTKYYLRCRALNKQGSIASKPILLETKACELAQIHTDSVTDLTVSSALLHASLAGWGSDTIPVVGFCVADHQNATVEDNLIICLIPETKDTIRFEAPLEELEDNKTYYFRSYAINCKGIAYGEEVSFTTTEILLPTLKAVTFSDVTYTSAKVASEVTEDGGAPVQARGFCYSTLQNPTVESARITCGEGAGAFDGELINLDDGKKYYVRAYAMNIKGVAYSEEVVFTTNAYGAPTVTTSEPGSISYTTATVGGSVTADGGKTVTERGVCYSTLPEPTIASSKMKSGSGLGAFSCNLTELDNGTTYYVRAYATNEQGTSYGETKIFTTTEYALPTVATTEVTNITYTSATAGGSVIANGGATIITRGVCYSTEPDPTILDNVATSTYAGLGTFTCSLPDLADGTTYYIRAFATNVKGTAYGEELTFSTPAYGQPVVTTSDVVNITYTSAKASGNVMADGGKEVTERGICYAIGKTPTLADNVIVSGKGIGMFTCDLTNLENNTTYNVCAYAINSIGITYGEMKSFTTIEFGTPVVSTGEVSGITAVSATAGGKVTDDGGTNVTERGVCFGLTENPTLEDTKVASGYGLGSFTCDLTGLTEGTTYHVRAYATNDKGTSYGDDKTFETTPYLPPTVTTGFVTDISYTTATADGNVTADGGQEVTEKGVCFATTSEPTIYNTKVAYSEGGLGAYTCQIADLVPGTTYYLRAYATNSKGTAYGVERTFATTSYNAPTVKTGGYSDVSYTTATCSGEITSDGGSPITEYGICYSTWHENPDINHPEDMKMIATSDTTSYFTCDLKDLNAGMKYYYRAYAVNSEGVAYGTTKTFTTTSGNKPSVYSDYAYNVSYTSADVLGVVSDDGGLEVTERGVCYSTEHEPTIADSKVVNGSGTGEFTCHLTDLQDGTMYYYRAYATNIIGTSYSSNYWFATYTYELASVSTAYASDVTYTTATVGGNVSSNGGQDVTERGICISRSTYYPTVEEDSVIVCGDGLGEFTHTLTNLADGTTYYYRAYAKNAKGVAYGSTEGFTTPGYLYPSVSTKSASNVSYTTATVGGEVTSGGGLDVTEFGICISRTNNYPTVEEDSVIAVGIGLSDFVLDLTQLQDGTYYYYRAYAKNAKGVGYGDSYSFGTINYETPTLSTIYHTNLSYTSVTIGGEVTKDGGLDVIEYGICISRVNTYPTYEEDSVIVCGSGLGEFTHDLTNLKDGTYYSYRAFARNAKGVAYGGRDSFTTKYYYVPSVSTTSSSNVSYTSATVGGEVSEDEGHLEITEYGICISRTRSYPTVEEDSVIVCGSGEGKFTYEITNLKDGTYYNYRAYAKNAKGVGYGSSYTFRTNDFANPSVSTKYYSNVEYTTATVGGNVTEDGGHEVIERGICISLTNYRPTVEEDSVIPCGSGLGEFTHELTNLQDGVRYYYRAYAKSSYGVGYGTYYDFVTNGYSRPSVSTYDVSEISYFSAKFNGWSGNVSEHPTKERGFCYSTSPNPTINDTKVIMSGVSGDFNVVVEGLEAGTTYYVRAYAFNEYSPKYGSEREFTTLPYSVPTLTTTDATGVSFESAVCGGKVTAYGGKEVTAYGVCYSTSPNPTIYDNAVPGLGDITNFLSGLDNLTHNTTYYYRAYATNEEGTGYGPEKSFTTVDYNSAVIYYTAANKLTETTSGYGLHTNAFGVTIESHTFENGQGTIRFTDKVTVINSYAFEYCTEMTSVTLPYSIKYIYGSSFMGCTGLTSFDVPQDVQYFYPRDAFSECYTIAYFHVDPNNQYFCDINGVLFSKDKQTLLRYPAAMTETSYSIPSGVLYIDEQAFRRNTTLTSVEIPQTVKEIRYRAFRECSGLTAITIPNSVTRIHSDAFEYCTSVSTVDIGSGVTAIDSYAFDNCPNITSVTCRALNPPSGSGSFNHTDKTVVPLYVPKVSINSYKNADGWKDFTNIVAIP